MYAIRLLRLYAHAFAIIFTPYHYYYIPPHYARHAHGISSLLSYGCHTPKHLHATESIIIHTRHIGDITLSPPFIITFVYFSAIIIIISRYYYYYFQVITLPRAFGAMSSYVAAAAQALIISFSFTSAIVQEYYYIRDSASVFIMPLRYTMPATKSARQDSGRDAICHEGCHRHIFFVINCFAVCCSSLFTTYRCLHAFTIAGYHHHHCH